MKVFVLSTNHDPKYYDEPLTVDGVFLNQQAATDAGVELLKKHLCVVMDYEEFIDTSEPTMSFAEYLTFDIPYMKVEEFEVQG